MIRDKNIIIEGADGKPIVLDIFYMQKKKHPVVIYAHGFNGFKDWANFDLIADEFAMAGFAFIKFNFSHNGTTPENLEEFTDMKAYGHNNYTKELFDLQAVINWAMQPQNFHASVIDQEKLFLIGHSKGGGIVLLKTAEEHRVNGVATWASVSQCKTPWGNWPQERVQKWAATGVDYYINSRTKQEMPLYYQLHTDYLINKDRLNIIEAVKKIKVPVLICHGSKDEAVPVSNANLLHQAMPTSELFIVETDHVFGRKHPWHESYLPKAMQEVVDKTIQFFKSL